MADTMRFVIAVVGPDVRGVTTFSRDGNLKRQSERGSVVRYPDNFR